MRTYKNEVIALGLVFYLCVNFSLPWTVHHVFAMLFAPFILLLALGSRTVPKVEIIVLLMFSLCYTLFIFIGQGLDHGIGQLIKFAVTPVCFYLVGVLLVDKCSSQLRLLHCYLFVILVFSLFAMLSGVKNYMEYGFSALERNINLIGQSQEVVNATAINVLLSPWLGMAGIIFVKFNTFSERSIKIIVLVIVFICAFVTFSVVSRTGLAIVGISSVLVMVSEVMARKIAAKSLILIFIAISMIVVASPFVLSDFLDAFIWRAESNLGGSDSLGGRIYLWEYYLLNIYENPLVRSGDDIAPGSYAHNYIIDIARVGGVLSALLMLIFTVMQINKFFEFYQNNSILPALRKILPLSIIGLFCTFLVEPVLEGVFNSFLLFCFGCGICNSMISKLKSLRANSYV